MEAVPPSAVLIVNVVPAPTLSVALAFVAINFSANKLLEDDATLVESTVTVFPLISKYELSFVS